MGSLASELEAFHAAFLDRADPDIVAAIARSQRGLVDAGHAAQARRAGEIAPDFLLPDQTGRDVSLRGLLQTGPVVLVFFRGGWCPFCALSLRAYGRIRPALRRHGAELVAISPEQPALLAGAAERHGLDFPVLSDHDNTVARAYGLAWALDSETRDAYARLGHSIPEANGTSNWELPMPASYVISPDGRIAFCHVDPAVERRAEPEHALSAVMALDAG